MSEPVPLYRNRNYNVLWTGQLLSELVGEVVLVGLPLLVIAMAGSPLQIGAVSSVLATAHMVAVIPAGVIVDRFDRRKVLLLCQGVRAAALVGLVVALGLDQYSFPLLLAVAAIEGVFGAMFDPAEHAALPQVVPESQLATAVARNSARPFIATLAGPALAGLLFELHPMHPFVMNAVMLGVSFGALLLLRLPRRPAGASDSADDPAERGVVGDVATALRWLFGVPAIRTTLVWMIFANLVFTALIVIILVSSGEDGVGSTQIGVMMSCFGAGGLLGAVFAARLHAALPAPAIILGFTWVLAAATGLMAVVPSGVPLGVLLGVAAFGAPAANTTVLTYQLMVTPDELRGKLSAVAGFCSGGAGALGPLAGGLLATWVGRGGDAIAACAVGLALVAIGTTLSPTLRRFPTLHRS